MRIDYDPAQCDRDTFYRLLTATVVPRPIAWVSTTSADGTDNLAPHSFFTVSCVSPPVVQFTSVGRKDSLRNIEDTGAFAVGVEREASLRVKPPRVAASPVALECELHSTVRLGDSTVVFGRVVHAAISPEVMADGHPEVTKLAPLTRLGKDEWGMLGDVREISRVPYAQWQDGGAPH
jgi:flavin reductase (DIM6/NTAB) family NADH-FMN oxidoreductase RutF